MVFEGLSVVIFYMGKVCFNNQDFGYFGVNLFVVVDGMGGYVGGDVVLSIVIQWLELFDQVYFFMEDVQVVLQVVVMMVVGDFICVVKDCLEFVGFGIIFSVIIMVDEYVVIGYIGDLCIYLYCDDVLIQIIVDYMFVQCLVDFGCIMLEEVCYYFCCFVLMWVFSDMDLDFEFDMFVMYMQFGDCWLLCFDGLFGVVDEFYIFKVMQFGFVFGCMVDNLFKQVFDGGVFDNVMIVLVDVGGQYLIYLGILIIVGLVLNFDGVYVFFVWLLCFSWLYLVWQVVNEFSYFELVLEYFEEFIEEDCCCVKCCWLGWIVGVFVVVVMFVFVVFVVYSWMQMCYFIGVDEDSVVIFQGVQQNIGLIILFMLVEDIEIFFVNLLLYQWVLVECIIIVCLLFDVMVIVD